MSKAERDDPTSVPVQLADCRERAAEEGWSVVGEYTDDGISAWNPKKRRPAYEALLDDVAAGRIDTILVRETERLLRSQKDAVRIADLAETGHLKLIACTLESDVNFARARDRKEFRDRASSAQFYSDFLSEKVRRTKQAQMAAGAYTGGGRPFGYTFTKDGLAVEPKEAALIHEAVKRLARRESLYRITMDWNAARTVTAGGARWRPATLRRMLTGAHLTGGNGYARILSDVEATIVRQELEAQPKAKRGRPIGRRYAATGLVFCAECGQKMSGGAGAYRCSASHGGCGRVSIKATDLERYLLDAWVEHDLTTRKRAQTHPKRAAPGPTPESASLLAELREVERRLEEVATGLADGTLTVGVAGGATQRLEERRRSVTEQLARALPPPEPAPSIRVIALESGVIVTTTDKVVSERDGEDFLARWKDRALTESEVAQLQEFFGVHIARVTVVPRAKRGKAFESGRVTTKWR